MRKTKRRLETLSFYDRTGVGRHLEKMAAKGWLIDRVTSFGWVYRRIEPKKLRFAVTYYPKASDFDPGPTEDQQVYHDMTEQTGWHYAASWAQMQIFYTDQPDAVPIETDPELELETIHAAMKKTFFPGYGILLAVSLFYLIRSLADLSDDPIGVFSSAIKIGMLVQWPLLALVSLVEIAAYLFWYRRAQKAAECGEFVDTPNTHWFRCVMLTAWLVCFALTWLYILTSFSSFWRIVAISILLYTLLMMGVVGGVKQLLKNRKVSRGVNRAVTIAVDVVLAFGMMAAIVFGTLRATENGWLDSDTAVDELPLTLAELWGDELPEAAYQSRWTEDASPLAAVYDGKEEAYPLEQGVSTPSLDYTVIVIKLPALYDRCRTQLVEKKIEISYRQIDVVAYRIATPCDAAPWGANEAWQVTWENDIPGDDYLLCYDRNLVEISFSWTPTDAQKALVGEKLGDL
ncbi:DUF2812 domain-containing protein [Agathobaculum sp. Marseille-P7918]|uniref:DUF2812 domain-containing protein n=1 Tax=Agathobaculum sp. Marseille-P7918 TaxID=2479843 RepID=UPI000F62F07D|nr:DUF2812 domain-containing protein [Agathobaculum sp. Marseille-P7918]